MKNVCLVGNPNCGKTTLFNKLTNSFEHTGNYNGVTVDVNWKTIIKDNQNVNVVDLPGCYSLSPFSIEEKIASNYLFKNECNVINVCEPQNIKRALVLTLELIEANFNVIIVINNKGKDRVDKDVVERIEKKLGIQVFEINVLKDNNFSFLLDDKIYGKGIKNIYISKYENCAYDLPVIVPIKICEEDKEILKSFNITNEKYLSINNKLFKCNLTSETIIRDRTNIIKTIISKKSNIHFSILDKVFLNKFLAFPIFFSLMLFIFYLTFSSVGAFISNALYSFISEFLGNKIVNVLTKLNTNFIFNDFVISVIVESLGSLICFLPQIVLLFTFVSILEDSGYLPRIAFLLDDIFSKVGLNGKSLFTLMMSFGCSTTAMMLAKNQDNEKSKIKTMMLTQYMSCSAKLPIFTVLCSAFFTHNVLLIFGFYIIGIMTGLIVVVILQNFVLCTNNRNFVLEMPKYAIPNFKKVFKVALINCKNFINRIFGVVLLFMVVIWFLKNFNYKFEFVKDSSKSLLYGIGGILAPIFKPLGFGNYGIVSALLVGLIAKEIIISAFALFNNNGGDFNLVNSLTSTSSVICFTSESALSFMVFVLLYSPCISSLSLMKKEIGVKYLLVAMVLQFAFAYILSFFVYTLALLLSASIITMAIIISFLLLVLLYCLNSKNNKCVNCKNSVCENCKK